MVSNHGVTDNPTSNNLLIWIIFHSTGTHTIYIQVPFIFSNPALKSVSLSTPRGSRCSLHSTCALPVGTGRIERRNKTRFKLCQQSPWMIDATKFQVRSPLQTIPGKLTELLKIAIYGWFTMIYLIKIG